MKLKQCLILVMLLFDVDFCFCFDSHLDLLSFCTHFEMPILSFVVNWIGILCGD